MKKQTTPLLLLALYGLLICAMLVLAAAGVRCYTAVVETRSAHTRQRSAMAYLQTQASACGGQNAVQLREGPQGVAVCLRDPDTDYETRVYCYDGWLYTEYLRAELPMDPQKSDRLCEVQSFSAVWQSEELLRVTADGRSADIWCPGGGGNAD